MTAFLSYSSVNKGFAAKLRDELARQGLTVWSDDAKPGTKLSERIEAGIQSSTELLVLVGPRDGDGKDEKQELTWRLLLEAAWKDRSKRLIPILLMNTALPPFVLSAFRLSSMDGADIPVIRVRDPRDVAEAAQAVVQVTSGEGGRQAPLAQGGRKTRRGPNKVGYAAEVVGPRHRDSVSFESSAAADAGTKRGYAVHLDEIGQFAKSLKN